MTEPLKLLRRHPKVKPQKLQRLSKTTLQDQAYSEIKEALMSGHFTPGDILVIKAGEVHGFKAIGDGPLVQLDVHLSPRFIQENLT